MADDRLRDEILAHSEDEGEWEDEPERIESRSSGTQVVSARLPSQLAEALLAAAEHRNIRPSEAVREAVEKWLRCGLTGVIGISASAGQNMRVITPAADSRTENFNLVVQPEISPERVEILTVALSVHKPLLGSLLVTNQRSRHPTSTCRWRQRTHGKRGQVGRRWRRRQVRGAAGHE
jgi:hypothetical protein